MTDPQIQHITIKVLPDGRVSARDAAAYLGMKQSTLRKWRCIGRGPAWMTLDGRAYYKLAGLQEYVALATKNGGQ